jgi:transcriptional regulator with XRE-family HTH domain
MLASQTDREANPGYRRPRSVPNVQLTAFLRERRHGMDRNAHHLGDFPRRHSKWGMPVTQEEMAEALGVSRVWYATFESEPGTRASISLLNRVATVFRLNEWERIALLGIAIPELRETLIDLVSQCVRTFSSTVPESIDRSSSLAWAFEVLSDCI